MVYGGTRLSDVDLVLFLDRMREWREENNMTAELKWKKVSACKLPQYKSLVDLFFELASSHKIYFKSLVVNTSEIDFNTYHEGDRELGFYKLYYQLLLHKFVKFVQPGTGLIVHLDQRPRAPSYEEFKTILNRGALARFGMYNPVRNVEAIRSHDSDCIQIADVLMGAIGWEWNSLGARPDARPAKKELAAYIARKAGLLSLRQATPYRMRIFDIWKMKFY